MGSCFPFLEDLSLPGQVKEMAEEELLEMWEESQQIEQLLNCSLNGRFVVAPEFEQTILAELFIRSGKRLFPGAK